jgi:hypothetical protein
VYIFSTMHVSGQQLQQVSGVAAILRYPMPDLVSVHVLTTPLKTFFLLKILVPIVVDRDCK